MRALFDHASRFLPVCALLALGGCSDGSRSETGEPTRESSLAITCTTMYGRTAADSTRRASQSPIVTAGLKCAPETCPTA